MGTREEKKLVKMLLTTTCLLYQIILVMAVCFLVYFLQTAPRDLSEHGGQSSPTPTEKLNTEMWPLKRPKREVSGKGDGCLSAYNGIELDYVKGSTSSYTFDLCEVIDCKGANSIWRGYDVWVCSHPDICTRGGNPYSTRGIRPVLASYTAGQWCAPGWGNVVSWTGVGWQPHVPEGLKGIAIQRDFSAAQNPSCGQEVKRRNCGIKEIVLLLQYIS